MADFDLEALIFPAFSLRVVERITVRLLGGDPGAEEGGGIESGLEVANDLKGGD